MTTRINFFTSSSGAVTAIPEHQLPGNLQDVYARQTAINIARARGDFSAPVCRAYTVVPPATMSEAQADKLAHAGAAFDIVNGRAVQAVRLFGDGFAPLVGEDE